MLYRSKTFFACALVAILGFAAPSCGGGSDGDDDSGGSGGDGGGSGGRGGSGGARGGSGGGGSDPLHAREVENCDVAPTVKDVEQKIIGPTCAGIGCHRSEAAFGDYRFVATKSWATAAMEAKSTGKCKDEPIIDKEAPENSLMYRTLQDDPKCENGDDADKMPPSNALRMLSDEEKVCLEEYIKAVTRD